MVEVLHVPPPVAIVGVEERVVDTVERQRLRSEAFAQLAVERRRPLVPRAIQPQQCVAVPVDVVGPPASQLMP